MKILLFERPVTDLFSLKLRLLSNWFEQRSLPHLLFVRFKQCPIWEWRFLSFFFFFFATGGTWEDQEKLIPKTFDNVLSVNTVGEVKVYVSISWRASNTSWSYFSCFSSWSVPILSNSTPREVVVINVENVQPVCSTQRESKPKEAVKFNNNPCPF